MLMWNRSMPPCDGNASDRDLAAGIQLSRPHRALQDWTPAEFAKRVAENLLGDPVITAGDSP